MIEKIRKPKKSRNIVNYTIYTIIFGMIVATFVFMIPGMTGPTGAVNTAAEVGNATVSLRAYTDQLRMMRAQYQKMFRGEIPAFFESNLKSQVLESLVQAEVMKQFAKEEGIIVSDLEITNFLKNEIPAFQEDGRFSLARYNSYLKSVRMLPAKFEERIYNDILRSKLQQTFDLAFEESELEKKLMSNSNGYKLSLKYLKYDPSKFSNEIKVTEAQAKDFLSTTEGQEEVKSYYQANLSTKYKTEESANISYILFKDMKVAEEASRSLTKQNFAEKAKEYSQDPLSKEKGGDLGFIDRGEFPKEIEDKAFSLNEDEISKPFQTEAGPVVVWLKEKKSDETKEFDSIAAKVSKDFLIEKGVEVAKEKARDLSKSGETEKLEKLLLDSGHSWSDNKEFDVLANSVEPLGDVDNFFDSVISLNDGELSQGFVTIDQDQFLFRNEGLKTVPGSDKSAKEDSKLAAKSRGQDAYFLVYKNEKDKIDVQINEQLIAE